MPYPMSGKDCSIN